MIKEMIKALEGARAELVNNKSEINDIIRKLEVIADRIDDVTFMYSEELIPNYHNELYYGVMLNNEDYYGFNGEMTDDEFRAELDKLNLDDPYQRRTVRMIHQDFFDLKREGKKPLKAQFRDGYMRNIGSRDTALDLDVMIKELNKAIKELKELCQTNKE